MSVLSGGLVYEFSQETDNFGLVDINSTTKVTLRQDYNNLALQFAGLNIASLEEVNKTATAATATSCAASLVTGSNFTADWVLPTAPSGAAALITSGVSSGFVKGSVVAINTTTMSATVLNYTGATVTSLSLVELMCTDSNSPGLINGYKSSSVSCNYATATGGASATPTKKSAARRAAAGQNFLRVVALSTLFFILALL